ncbi:hypothetical protein FB45DRAFT_864472 [Roridomyces roridus]|uniref:Uncharacterized protein n=1 Tax=Roridomyces roridus TaxID=1738132 RepID=A0AAD7FTB3_9AGAR|nr:hypothetical protein FB45DRAFT_864472 [Roridomyces roridus]
MPRLAGFGFHLPVRERYFPPKEPMSADRREGNHLCLRATHTPPQRPDLRDRVDGRAIRNRGCRAHSFGDKNLKTKRESQTRKDAVRNSEDKWSAPTGNRPGVKEILVAAPKWTSEAQLYNVDARAARVGSPLCKYFSTSEPENSERSGFMMLSSPPVGSLGIRLSTRRNEHDIAGESALSAGGTWALGPAPRTWAHSDDIHYFHSGAIMWPSSR